MIDLVDALKQSETYFPPLLIASASDTLIAETYVSSHPLSGLILCGEPSSDVKPTTTFDYEPFFPIALVSMTGKEPSGRLVQDYPDDVDVLTFDSQEELLSSNGAQRALDWMASAGL